MFVCSSPQEALEEGETISTPTGPTTPGTPVSQIDTPPTIDTPEDQDSPTLLPVDTPDEPSGDTSGKESDREVGETEAPGKEEDNEGVTVVYCFFLLCCILYVEHSCVQVFTDNIIMDFKFRIILGPRCRFF